MLDCDMAGVIAAMRGTPKPRHLRHCTTNPLDAVRPLPVLDIPFIKQKSTQPVESEADRQAWQEYTDSLADVNTWRDEL